MSADLSNTPRLTSNTVALILSALKVQTKLGFSGCKTATLKRRIARRMELCRITDPNDYLSLLNSDHGEADALVSDLVIGVTYSPFSNIDLISCSNLLIYLTPESRKESWLCSTSHWLTANEEAVSVYEE